ncbi:MAG: bifunctional phosphoribosylaminoimidazolecarboxamide formyltransferase/IMP cyclohydrolase [Myxococcales bacterium]|nr:bifunctional phosphoribosylaminoimidazolecarboxamide formyltransferase/IMP cyclohydrolase [Myxococcales bacterium]
MPASTRPLEASVKRALISVTDKTGLIPFAEGLVRAGVELVSTGGTASALEAAGLVVTRVADLTRFPEMMDGRVKTLHPSIFGGILARRRREDDLAALAGHGIGLIDLVVVNLYAFEAATRRPNATSGDIIEQIDIGGPSLIRAAAKNHQDVLVAVDPADYPRILAHIEGASPEPGIGFALAAKAFAHTARYDSAIAAWFARGLAESAEDFTVAGTSPVPLRYGENPHQNATFYRTGPGYADAVIHQGKVLSYNNWLDAAAAYDLVNDLTGGPAVAIVKHMNPCGLAVSPLGHEDAWQEALATDPTSAFGGIVALNGRVTGAVARRLTELFLEVVVAPAFDDDALVILSAKKNLRVLECPPAPAGLQLRSIRGALLVQGDDTGYRDLRSCNVVTTRAPTDAEYRALQFAWEAVKHVKSNAIVFADQDPSSHALRSVAIGAGQMSRVDSVALCRMKARRPLEGTVAASDAFFPFRDGVELLHAAGATAIVQPGGSVRDAEVIAAANELGLAMVFTGQRHFRH